MTSHSVIHSVARVESRGLLSAVSSCGGKSVPMTSAKERRFLFRRGRGAPGAQFPRHDLVRPSPRVGHDRFDKIRLGTIFRNPDFFLQRAPEFAVRSVLPRDFLLVAPLPTASSQILSSGPDGTRPQFSDVEVPPINRSASHRGRCSSRHGRVANRRHGTAKVLGLLFHACLSRRCCRGIPVPSCRYRGRPEQILVLFLYLPSGRWASSSRSGRSAAIARGYHSRSRCFPRLHKYVEVVREYLDPLGHSPA